MDDLKIKVAKSVLAYIDLNFPDDNLIIGVGTGSTVNFFIKELISIKHRIDGCVASSSATAQQLRAVGIAVIDLNSVSSLDCYIDSADEVNARCEMIKGGGGALTGEKIIASMAEAFICIVDEFKLVQNLGAHPVAVEVIPMARSLVARKLVNLGGDPVYRAGFVTDNNNIILDVFNLDLTTPKIVEAAINNIVGVVESGIFAKRCADYALIAKRNEVITIDITAAS